MLGKRWPIATPLSMITRYRIVSPTTTTPDARRAEGSECRQWLSQRREYSGSDVIGRAPGERTALGGAATGSEEGAEEDEVSHGVVPLGDGGGGGRRGQRWSLGAAIAV